MINEFAVYIHGLTGELAKNIWLGAFINRLNNGTSVVVIRDFALKYRITEEEVKNLFDYKQAEKIGFIKVLAEGETFIAINFKNKMVPFRLPSGVTAKEKTKKTKTPTESTQELTITQNLPTQINKSNIIFDEHGLIISPIDANYKMTEQCKKHIIANYCSFFKKLQINKSYLAGVPMVQPVNPRISAKEVVQLREIAHHFISIGCSNEVKIIITFQRMYEQWENLSERLQKMSSPGGMLVALNDIIIELQQLNNKKNQPPKQTAKDEQVNSKIDAARQKDYSHLEKP